MLSAKLLGEFQPLDTSSKADKALQPQNIPGVVERGKKQTLFQVSRRELNHSTEARLTWEFDLTHTKWI